MISLPELLEKLVTDGIKSLNIYTLKFFYLFKLDLISGGEGRATATASYERSKLLRSIMYGYK